MKIVVVGGTGRIGSQLVARLRKGGNDVVPAAPDTGVDTLTCAGLPGALEGASIVVDVSDSPSFEPSAVLDFFRTSTRHLLDAEEAAEVRHHIVLSVVGTDRLLGSAYFRAKFAQEHMVAGSSIPYTVVRATQFFEFLPRIADAATDGETVRLPPVHVQPAAAGDVADALSRISTGPPANGIVEVGGPERFRLDELVARDLAARRAPGHIVADPDATYFGAHLDDGTLVPGEHAEQAPTRYEDWLREAVPVVAPGHAGRMS